MTTALKRPTRHAGKPTRASQTLDQILAAGGPVAKAIRKAFLRDQLWRFRSGARRPELESMFQLRDLTGVTKCTHCGCTSGDKLDIELWVRPPRDAKRKAAGVNP